MCAHCGGRTDTTTVIGEQDTTESVVEPGSRTAGEAAALRATLARIVQLMLEAIGGRHRAGQLGTVAEAPVLRYLPAARPTALAAPLVRSLLMPATRRWVSTIGGAGWPAIE